LTTGRYRLVLPTIPPPTGPAAVLASGQVIRGECGDTDLVCGNCGHVIAERLEAGQFKNLVLECPYCVHYNLVVDIPQLRDFVAHLQTIGMPVDKVPTFQQILSDAIEHETPAQQIAEQVQQEVPEFSWFKEYLIPHNPGELYAFLSLIVMLLVWWQQTRPKNRTEPPQVVINNFFGERRSRKQTGRNARCPCGSGKKFKRCHGRER
jgi:hypothetical protein